MGIFNRSKQVNPPKMWAITLETTHAGKFYVNKHGINVCCATDSSLSCGIIESEVAKAFNDLCRKNPSFKYEMVEI